MELVKTETRVVEGLRQSRATYVSRSGKPFNLHFTTPESYRLAHTDDAYFIMGALLAFTKREHYHQSTPVSQDVLRGFMQATTIWCDWYKFLRPMEIVAPIQDEVDLSTLNGQRCNASFFSGGIDSLFTCIQHAEPVSGLISIAHVSDNPDQIREDFAHLDSLRAYAEKTNRRHFTIATNMMTLAPEILDSWSWLGHGAALAATAHFLSGEVKHAIISSSDTWKDLEPWGSHPHVDPIFSNSQLQLSHFGNDFDRMQKTIKVSQDPAALGVLSVCHHGRGKHGFENCSQCSKCLRTMIALDLAGVDRDVNQTFDWSLYDSKSIEDHKLSSQEEMVFLSEMSDMCREQERADLASAIKRMIRNSQRTIFMKRIETFTRKRIPYLTHLRGPLIRLRNLALRAFG